MKTNVKHAVEHSTIHALPMALTSRSKFQRAFWLIVFLCASLLLVVHLHRLIMRYFSHEVSTNMRKYTNATIKFPKMYVTLFDSNATVDFPVPYKVIQRSENVIIYELSDWTKLEQRRELNFDFSFCSLSYYYQFGYIELVDSATRSWSPLSSANTIVQRGRTTILTDISQVQILPPPYSSCMNQYPTSWTLYTRNKPQQYTQRTCILACSLSVRFIKDCDCSMRNVTGVDLPEGVHLPSCLTTDDLPPEKANLTSYAKKTDNNSCIWDADQWLVANVGSSSNIDLLRNTSVVLFCSDICHDDCNYMEYESKDENSPIGFDEPCKPAKENSYKGVVTIDIDDRISLSQEQISYPLIEFMSEVVGILGAYIGFSVCTMGEFIEIAFYLLKPHVRRLFSAGNEEVDADDVEVGNDVGPATPRFVDMTLDPTKRRGSFDLPGEYQKPQPHLVMAHTLAPPIYIM